MYWRMAYYVSLLYPQWRCLVFTIIALGILFWTATKANVSGNKLRASNTSPNVLPDTKIPVLKNTFGTRPIKSSVLAQNNKTVIKESAIQNRNPKGTNLSPPGSPIRCRSPARRAVTDTAKKFNVNKKETYNESRPKPMAYSDMQQPAKHVANVHSVRPFKPQLEDIKSSYLLLNKKVQDVNMKTYSERSKSPIPIPNTFNEEMRKQQLMEIKRKFKSKQFWGDSKYDRIEGLNWISWK